MEAEISSCQQPGGFYGNIYFLSTGIQSWSALGRC